MKDITVIGIDIAKNVIQIYGTDHEGRELLKKRLKRERFLAFMAKLSPCLVGIEACGGSNYWAKELIKLGHDVKLMGPKKVKKFAECNKNDDKDAQACSIAVTRKNMQFVAIKSQTQQDIQSLHRLRSFYLKQHVAQMNMLRGLLLEYGIAIPQGISALKRHLNELFETTPADLSEMMLELTRKTYNEIISIEAKVSELTKQVEDLANTDEQCQRLLTIAGIGPITATAFIAKVGNGSEFKRGREVSPYLGLTPRQNSSGNRQQLLGITKHGDRYLRQLLIHGGRSVVKSVMRINKLDGAYIKQDTHSEWVRNLVDRVGVNRASVAVANRNARIAIALLKTGKSYDSNYAS